MSWDVGFIIERKIFSSKGNSTERKIILSYGWKGSDHASHPVEDWTKDISTTVVHVHEIVTDECHGSLRWTGTKDEVG